MRHINATKVFISAARPNQTLEETALAHDSLRIMLESSSHVSGFRQVAGCFNGELEPAFCAWLNFGHILEGIDALTAFGAVLEQDSILVVHGDGAAELVECQTDCSAILGRFVEVDKPEDGEDYTLADNRYFVVR